VKTRGGGWIWVAWAALLVSAVALCLGIGWKLGKGVFPPETLWALLLLLANGLFMVFAALFPRLGPPWNEPNTALLWVAIKLFVNSFTIFLFIGLHAGRTDVFVMQFFGAYLWLLSGSVLLLSRQP
jgi:hypothetical protein